MSGVRFRVAARPTVPATYPPPPSTASAPRALSSLRAAATARPAFPTARAALNGLLRLMPSTLSVSSAYPALGTSSASARSPPTKLTSAPSARSASATAIAGTTWPAVPPAAITILGGPAPGVLVTARTPGDGARVRRAPAGDVEQQAHRAQQHDQRGRARGDERQRNPRQRGEAEHGVDVEQGLAQDQGGQAAGEQLGVGALGVLRGPQPGVPDHAVEEQQAADTGDTELLADHGQDEV